MMIFLLRVRTWSVVLRTYTCDHCLIVRLVTLTTCEPPLVLWRTLKPPPLFLNPTYIDLLYLLYRALIESFKWLCYISSHKILSVLLPPVLLCYNTVVSVISRKFRVGTEPSFMSMCHKLVFLWLWCMPPQRRCNNPGPIGVGAWVLTTSSRTKGPWYQNFPHVYWIGVGDWLKWHAILVLKLSNFFPFGVACVMLEIFNF